MSEAQGHSGLASEPVHGSYSDKTPITALSPLDEKMILSGAISTGVFRIYFGESDFGQYRRFDETDETGITHLYDYLYKFAKSKVVIISHGMGTAADELVTFLEQIFIIDRKSSFEFTIILPQPGCNADLALNESSEKKYYENIEYIETRLDATIEKIKAETVWTSVNIFRKY